STRRRRRSRSNRPCPRCTAPDRRRRGCCPPAGRTRRRADRDLRPQRALRSARGPGTPGPPPPALVASKLLGGLSPPLRPSRAVAKHEGCHARNTAFARYGGHLAKTRVQASSSAEDVIRVVS